MLAWEHTTDETAQLTLTDGAFSREECARLTALRERVQARPDYIELGLDIRRLEFARWLVLQGKLSEEL
jgi:hypothetical protein